MTTGPISSAPSLSSWVAAALVAVHGGCHSVPPCRRHDGRGRGLQQYCYIAHRGDPHTSHTGIFSKKYVAADVWPMNAVMHQLRHQMQALKTIRAEARR